MFDVHVRLGNVAESRDDALVFAGYVLIGDDLDIHGFDVWW